MRRNSATVMVRSEWEGGWRSGGERVTFVVKLGPAPAEDKKCGPGRGGPPLVRRVRMPWRPYRSYL